MYTKDEIKKQIIEAVNKVKAANPMAGSITNSPHGQSPFRGKKAVGAGSRGHRHRRAQDKAAAWL